MESTANIDQFLDSGNFRGISLFTSFTVHMRIYAMLDNSYMMLLVSLSTLWRYFLCRVILSTEYGAST